MDAKPIASLRELAEAYAAVLAKHDRAEPFGDPAADQLRAVVRGAESPVDVPLEEFELIYTEGDSNNTRSIRVRYNTMLAQAAYDGAPPRAMAVEDLPQPVPGTCVSPRQSQQSRRAGAAALSLLPGRQRRQACSAMEADGWIWRAPSSILQIR